VLRRFGRPAASRLAVLLAAALVVGLAPQSAGATGGGAPAMSAEGCAAFNEYFQVNFAIAFLTGFAEAFEDLDTSEIRGTGDDPSLTPSTTQGGDTTTQTDIDQLQNLVFLVLSPKLEQSTKVLAKEAPRSVRKIFAAQRDVYRDGVALLRDDLGLTDEQIREIRDADFTEETPDTLADELDISREDLEAAAEEFGESSDVLKAEDATAAQSRAFERLAVGCGAVPDSGLDCDEVVSADLQQQLLEGTPTVENDGGTCTYTIESDEPGTDPEIAVDVYRSADAFGRLSAQGSATDEIDANNVVADGFASFSSFKTCGRTLYSLEGETTMVIALCLPEDAQVQDDMLTDLRDSVSAVVG
jgi:hypothetical protein